MENLTVMHIFVRGDITTPWFHETVAQSYPDHPVYLEENYKAPGKVQITSEVSEDGTLLIATFTLSSEEAKAEWMVDEHLKTMYQRREDYNKKHGITKIT